MGRKRGGASNNSDKQAAVWIPKRPKVTHNEPLSHLSAIMQYTGKFKMGEVKFTILADGTSTGAWKVQTVINEEPMCEGEGDSRDKAIEEASISTLALLDPSGKSLDANVHHPDPSQLTKLQRAVEEAGNLLRQKKQQQHRK